MKEYRDASLLRKWSVLFDIPRGRDEYIFNASACGDNCAKWILYIARELGNKGTDLVIRLGYLMDFGNEPFEIEIENLGIIVHSSKELVEAVLDNRLI